MQIHDRLLEEFHQTVEELRVQLLSNDLRLKPVLYDLLCQGFEIGKLRGTRKRQPCALEDILTISHEASFRLELALAISSQGFRHCYKPASVQAKAQQFDKFQWVVKKERDLYATMAWEERTKMLVKQGIIIVSDDEDEQHAYAHGEVQIDEALY